MGLVASSVNRSDIDDLFLSRVRKPAPRKTEQAKHYQNDAKRFAHGSRFRHRLINSEDTDEAEDRFGKT